MAERRGAGTPLAIAAFVVFLVLFVTGQTPFALEFPAAGMEGSWIYASVYAGLHRLAYGTEFVFTNGPLFPLYHREYAGPQTLWYVLARTGLVLYLAYGFARLAPTPKLSGWLLLVVAFAIVWPSVAYLPNDTFQIIVPLLLALLVLSGKVGKAGLTLGVVLTAALCMAKISIIPFSLGAMLLIDIALLSRRRLPAATLGFAAVSWALFVLAGQHWDQFGAFLVGCYQMTAGYSAALSLDGPAIELPVWLAGAGLVLALLLIREIAAVRADAERWLIATLRIALVAGFLFITLKAGFVRHDSHSAAAWGALLFLCILLSLPQTTANWRPWAGWAYQGFPILIVGTLLIYSFVARWHWTEISTTGANVFVEELKQAGNFASDPNGWLAEQDAHAAALDAETRAQQPLPEIAGTVDSLSNIQAAVIAAGLDYTPRPTIQENMTFSPALIERNRAFLAGDAAPDMLLFAPGATDGRHPASIEGSLWPLLLARYADTGRAGDQTLLARRDTPLTVTTTTIDMSPAGFGSDIALPSGTRPLFLKLSIAETLLGKLVEQAFKPPQVQLVARYADGSEQSWRLIPGMIREGMLIAPTVATLDSFDRLTHGADLTGEKFPVSLRVTTDGAWAYEPAIGVSLEALTVPPN